MRLHILCDLHLEFGMTEVPKPVVPLTGADPRLSGPVEERLGRYFDTTVYSQEAMELLIKVVGVDNVIFASEMLGGVNVTDPGTGRPFDDNRRFIDSIPWLTGQDRKRIFEDNARTAYPRLGAAAAKI
jgi:4-oxalmesaconate hydratase